VQSLSKSTFNNEKLNVANISSFKGMLTSLRNSELFLSENFSYDQYLQVYWPTGAGVLAETVQTQRTL
jgi:hypothetical protein